MPIMIWIYLYANQLQFHKTLDDENLKRIYIINILF